MRRFSRIASLGVALFGCAIASGQQQPSPPQTALWEEQANGDAIQKDLGFILPRKWKNFERQGFTSTRADGASVKVHYLSEDKALKLAIMLQLRVDIRGLDLPPDLVWGLMRASAEAEYADRSRRRPEELSTDTFSLGKRQPAGRSRWAHYDLGKIEEVQGLWWQNIGIWSVVITMSGPEARRPEIEAAANTLFAEMPFPSAPIAAELAAVGEKLFATMAKCTAPQQPGTGAEIVPTFQEASMLGLLMPGLVLGRANDSLITPVTGAKDYCVVETFYPRKDFPVTAIAYTGLKTEAWEARYGFALNNGRGGYYQVERLAQSDVLSSLSDGKAAGHAYLDFSNNKRASVAVVFDDWPSYEVAKQAVTAMHANEKQRREAVITMTNPAEKVLVVTNTERIQKLEE